jgi:hypothetical protein
VVAGAGIFVQNMIAEGKVLTTTLPVEYGHSAEGAISVVKMTGTNELHGLISEWPLRSLAVNFALVTSLRLA